MTGATTTREEPTATHLPQDGLSAASLLRGCWGWAGPAAPRGDKVAGSLEKEEMPSVGVSLPFISLLLPQHLAILVMVSLILTVPQGLGV